MGINIKWDITYKCNLNCKHCMNGNLLGNIHDELTTNEVVSVINKLSKINVEYIQLLGGEPTARNDFLEIAQHFNNKKIFFGFNTNGLKFNDDKILREISKNRYLKNITFSIEGPTAAINDTIRGKNVFDITVKNLVKLVDMKKQYQLNNLNITVNMVITKLNKDYIADMIDFCLKIGIDTLTLLQLIPQGNATDIDIALDFNDELNIVKLIAQKYKKINNRLEIIPKFTTPLAKKYCENVLGLKFPDIAHGCKAGVDFVYMNNKGEVYPCDRYINKIKYRTDVENISLVNNEFYDILGLPGYDDIYIKTEGAEYYNGIEPCNSCEYLQKSCYPCPVADTISKQNIKNSKKKLNCLNFIKLISDYNYIQEKEI